MMVQLTPILFLFSFPKSYLITNRHLFMLAMEGLGGILQKATQHLDFKPLEMQEKCHHPPQFCG
jgi:hypothetical protein